MSKVRSAEPVAAHASAGVVPNLPKWERLHQDLLRRIATGEFSGSFPGEHELSEAYGLSRHTVREALRRLREAGIVDSSRGRVTRVNPQSIEQPLGGLYSLFREVEARGHVQRSDVLAMQMTTNADAAASLELPADAPLFYLERLRRSDGEPLAHDRVWLPGEIGEPLLQADFTHAALYDELTRRSGLRPTGGLERVSAVVPTPQQREMLSLKRGVACFEIERVGQVPHRPPIEYRLSLVRGDRYTMTTAWTPTGYRVGANAP